MYGTSQGYGGGSGCGSCGSGCGGGGGSGCSYGGGRNTGCGYSNLEKIAENYEGKVFSCEVNNPGNSYGSLGSYGGSGGYGGLGSYGGLASSENNNYGFSSNLNFKEGNANYNKTENNFLNKNFNYKSLNEKNNLIDDFLKTKLNQEYRFIPDNFLRPDRRRQKFVGKAEEIQSYVEEAFGEVMGFDFPEDIQIKVCGREAWKKLTGHPATVGLSINRREEGLLSEVFVLEAELDRVLLTVGHELGHVLSKPLPDKRDEEAKAFAFSWAWMEKIKEKDIAGLGRSIALDKPAKNGLHDLAFGWVWQLVKEGKKALEVYKELVGGVISAVSAENYFN